MIKKIEDVLFEAVLKSFDQLYSVVPDNELIQIQKTRKDFKGELTVVVFPLLKFSGKNPELTANSLGDHIVSHYPEFTSYNVVKGFLNISVSREYWIGFLSKSFEEGKFGFSSVDEGLPAVMVEYSSPNTNKPLHLGHIRNNLLGYSLSMILEATGRKVVKVNLVNDRGIHICKSMLACQKWGKGESPESAGKKGDKLVGDYYVLFDKEFKKELETLKAQGLSEEEAVQQSSLMNEAREMLRKWETGDAGVNRLWNQMNSWVYEGFDNTYRRLGVSFDKIYYESETYKLGKDLVTKGLENGALIRKEDGSVWADLSGEGLDSKLLLRSDGTSVYMTQDLGTAHQRFSEYNIDQHIYVVGNEQNYHFQVLKLVLLKLGYPWAEQIHHLSYGMVELPEGKMKSREGTVVDADDLMDEMVRTAREMSDELGKLSGLSGEEKENIYHRVGLAALKYFILKVDPKKNMTFNPAESIDFNGNTGPFIQYTYARIQSVLRKSAASAPESTVDYDISDKEISLIRTLYDFPAVLQSAGRELNPSLLANYLYELAREFNQFYHDHSILNVEDPDKRVLRLALSSVCGKVLDSGMGLLGIEMPDRM